jgi:glutamine amidotransferase
VIALIDYGAGNLTSVRKALAAVGAAVVSPRSPVELRSAAAVIVPGVGHFQATSVLDGPWRAALVQHVRENKPLLGICLGMQWLYEGSEEAVGVPGLGLLPGWCSRVGRDTAGLGSNAPAPPGVPASQPRPLKVPHVGWNTLDVVKASSLIPAEAGHPYAYFTHSYGAPITEATVATTTYGGMFASACEHGRVFGVQFHPEKSGDIGLAMLRRFVHSAMGG